MVHMRGNVTAIAGISMAQLESADRQALAAHYRAIFGVTVGPRASLAFLRGNLTCALQARQQGQDPVALRKRLTRQLSAAVNANARQQSDYRAGTRLARECTRVSKARRAGSKHTGGKPFARGALYTILKNPVYIGKVAHKCTSSST